ncbi:MAG: FCD domain-containing protein [Treponema sp.]|jgi:GntR family transcriptional repressor for pyruvate dehydrogenase complex|nr:FCD domain-containing protein [Treponema sp.]
MEPVKTEKMPVERSLKEKTMDIITICLQKGSKFPSEAQLAKEFCVSRTALREVLSPFEASGIITSQQGSGRYVQMPDISEQIADIWGILLRAKPGLLMDFLEIRSILEINSLKKAISRVDAMQLRHLGEQVHIMKQKAARGEAFVTEDSKFHRTLFESTGNVLLQQLLTTFWNLFSTSHINKIHSDLVKVASQHEKIYAAVIRQDLPLLKTLMKEQFADARYRIAQFLLISGT